MRGGIGLVAVPIPRPDYIIVKIAKKPIPITRYGGSCLPDNPSDKRIDCANKWLELEAFMKAEKIDDELLFALTVYQKVKKLLEG